eukprot:TRINITY_DN13584_c0_g3_i3.p1 TRINITY_DN13584_c0_g3~~TRINITY_DN13584_c0_g3_i3.p1  ORF type:complete len:261 (+),score=32.05 TRINITY_DN13584_c0_g3_i3:158-940(+)
MIIYNAAVSACAKGQQWAEGFRLFREAQRRDLTPTIISYGTLINALESGQDWSRALALLLEARQMGLKLNLIAYSACLNVCEQARRWSETLKLLTEMRMSKVVPNPISVSFLLSASAKSGVAPSLVSSLRELRKSVWREYQGGSLDLKDVSTAAASDQASRSDSEPIVCALSKLLSHEVVGAAEERLLRARIHVEVEDRLCQLWMGKSLEVHDSVLETVTGFGSPCARTALSKMQLQNSKVKLWHRPAVAVARCMRRYVR